ncbi:protein shank isoform X2 [Octopus sinensis]|uniref:Protein shank isoform X2 n=1 Tax=Octopus sinensis TaxID=2607531 RepID=A0A7E6FH97_9MOLL|nr:protein shank isoform X2 [Octopus sinensis]
MNTFRTSSSYIEDYNPPLDAEDMEFMMNPNDYIPIPNQDNVGTVYIRISLPELNVQKCLQFQLGESVWHAKQQILASFGSELRDGYNYGLYCPPQNGKAGKFLDEERLLREYPLSGPIGYLEFKFKRRVYRSMELNTRKLKQIHNKANLKQFIDAVKHGNKERVDKFLTKGLDPNYIDRDSGETPLTLSCTLGSDKSRSMIITLVSGGAHMDFRNRHGFTPMHKSAICSNRESIKTLLDLGASPNYKDLRYLTPLYYVVSKDDPVCAELLLNERAIIGTTDEQGWFEIHQACRSGKVQILEHLIYYGADMDVQNASGNTPLHVCAVTNQESCIRVLLFRGANKVIVNLNNQTPYEAAIIAGNLDLAEIIKGYSSADIVPFRELPQYSSRRTIKYSTNFRLSKCRSETRLNLSMMDSNFFKPDGSFHRYSMSSDCYSVTNSDSPRSISSSSTYSGHINGGLHMTDHDYYDGRRENYEENWYPYSVEETNLNSRRRTCSLGDLDADTEYFQRKTIKQRALFNHLGRHFINNYAPRAVTLRKTPNGYGFVLRGARSDHQFLNHVSNNSPAVQYLDTVDAGSAAEKAGLRAGDFILEINDENVTRASHEHVVKLIKNSGNMLRMTVLTVKPTDQDKNAFVHEDGSFTLPSRRRQAPEPPRRDPSTSLSFSKAKSKSFAEGMAEIEKLDQTLAEFEVCESPTKENSYSTYQNAMKSEIKTASIRAAYAKKRLSNIEIDNICSMEAPHKPDRLSPSEVRIKKYHKKTSSLEKSRSTPNLAPDLDYAQISSGNSSYSSNSSGLLRSQQAKMNASQINQLYPAPYLGSLSQPPPGMDLSGCRHSVAIGSSVHINSLPSRGKAYPVPPPVVSNHYVSPKEHIPPPPQVITINTQNDQSVNSTGESTKHNSYESSFRPGTVAVFGNNKKLVTNQSSVNQAKSHKPQDSLNRNKSANNFNSNLNSVTKTVIADVHHIDQSQGTQHYSNGTHDTYYEPQPDYESDGEDNLAHDGNGNIISVGSNLTKNRMSLAVPLSSSSSSSESFKTASTTPSFQNTVDPQIIPPPPEFCPPPPPEFSHAPPAPPPPPSNQLCAVPPPPPQFSSAPLPESQDSQAADPGNELLNEIKRAAQERQNRCKDEIPEKTTPKPTSVNLTPQDKNQAEILQAVAKRRSMLENSDENIVVNQIEAQIHKAKKLQYSKYYFTGNRMKKVVKELPEENTLEVEENKQNTEENKPVVKENKPVVKESKPVVKENKPVVKDAKVDVKQKGLNEGKINSASSEDKPISKVVLKPKLLERSTDKLPTESNSNKTTVKTLQNQAIKSQNGKVEPHVNDDSKKGQEDFLIKAEKARQRYLSRKSLGTNNETADKANRTATQTEISDKPNNINAHTKTSDKPNSTATHTETIDKPNSTATNNVKSDKSYNIARVNENKTYNSKKEPEPCVISHKTVEKNKINTDQTRHGVQNKTNPLIKRTTSKVHIEIKPALNVSSKPISGVSIKERIANLQNNNGLATNNSRDGVKLITVKGVTTGHSNTDPSNSSDCSTPSQSPYHTSFVTIVAPPPGFCDSDTDERATDELPSYPTLQTLPAPLSELSISVDQIGDIHPPDDSLSLISSLSTLSTLSTSSTEHPIDIVHPPPTSFQDGSSPVSTDQGFEESFIAAPQEFNEPLKKHNITKHSYQNKSVEEWLYVDVLEWLDSLKLTQYKTNFSHHCIDGKKLLNLNRNDYLMLGITQVTHRLNLEKAIKKALLASKSCQKSPVTSKISSSMSH